MRTKSCATSATCGNRRSIGGRACCPTPRARSRCATSMASRSARPRVVVSTQHEDGPGAGRDQAHAWPIVETMLPKGWMCPEEEFHVNPTGKFVIGGPDGDCGLTGRKIIVDTYGGAAPHGGGAFSGKDPTKVDRSRRLCLPLSGEERRRRRPGRPLHPADQLRDRHFPPAVGLCRPAGNRQGRGRGAAGEDAARR